MNCKRFQPVLIHLDVVDSTNNYAAKLINETNVTNGTAILTKRQTNGKGQRGNQWQTDADKNLIVSVITFPEISFDHVFYLNIVVSLAVYRTLKENDVESKIKWPNDIYIDNQKVGGILIENQLQGKHVKRSIIGLGLNVNQTNFDGLQQASSLTLKYPQKEWEVLSLFHSFYEQLDFYLDLLMQGHHNLLLKHYYKVLYGYNQIGEFEDTNGSFTGEIKGIDSSGRLLILKNGEIIAYDLKEVKFIIPQN